MNMQAKQKYKVVLGIAVVIIVIAVFGLILVFAEKCADARADAAMERASAYTAQPVLELYDEEEDVTYVTYHDIESFLVIGTDASGNETATGEEYSGNLADFLLLIIIDNKEKTYGFLQVDRDTVTDVPILLKDGTSYASAEEQICLAHHYGADSMASGENTVNAVSALLLGLPIDGYYAVNMDEMPAVNALLGGVTITLTEDLTQIDPAFAKGATVTLTDEQAERFIRARQGVGDESNTARMNRQLLFMNAAMEKAKQRFAADNRFVNEFYDGLSGAATTDTTEGAMTKLASKLFDYTSLGVLRLEGEHKTGVSLSDGLVHEQFYPDKTSILEVLKALGSIEVYEEADEESMDEDTEEETDDEGYSE